MVGVSVTETLVSSVPAAETVMTPAPVTPTVPAYLVVVEVVQEDTDAGIVPEPVDWKISLTQVRALLAANTTSDTLAFFV